MKLCIVSDSHDQRALLERAITDARAQGAQAVVHCGDIVAGYCLLGLQELGLPAHLIYGNNAGDLYTLSMVAQRAGDALTLHGPDATLMLGGRRLFAVHYPHYARGMAATGDYDAVCCGHDHRPAITQQKNLHGGNTLIVNPGTVGGIGHPPTYALLDLATLTAEIRPVQV